jgi:hypothetical protein
MPAFYASLEVAQVSSLTHWLKTMFAINLSAILNKRAGYALALGFPRRLAFFEGFLGATDVSEDNGFAVVERAGL